MFGVQGSKFWGFKVWGLGFKSRLSRFRVWCSKLKIYGFRVEGVGFRGLRV